MDAISSQNFVVTRIIRHDGIKRNHLLHLYIYSSEYFSILGLLFNFQEFIYINIYKSIWDTYIIQTIRFQQRQK